MKKKIGLAFLSLLGAFVITNSIPNIAQAVNTDGNPSKDYGIGFSYNGEILDKSLSVVHEDFSVDIMCYVDINVENPENKDISSGTFGIDAGTNGFISYVQSDNLGVSLCFSDYGEYTLNFTFQDEYNDNLSYYLKINIVNGIPTEKASLTQDSFTIDINTNKKHSFSIENVNPSNTYILSYDESLLLVNEENYVYTITPLKVSTSKIYISEVDSNMDIINNLVVDVEIYALNSDFSLTFDIALTGEAHISYKLSEDIASSDYDVIINVNGVDIALTSETLLIKDFNNNDYKIFGKVYDNKNNLIIQSETYYFKKGVSFVPEIKEEAVDISFSKEGEGSFTIFDNINIEASLINYSIKETDIINWYIDNEKILENTLSFVRKFEHAKDYEIKVEIVTSENTLIASKKLTIKEDKNAQMELSISSKHILACVEGDIFTVSALLDNMILKEFDYSWIIEDTDILTFYVDPSSSDTVALKPLKEGTTKLYVSCDFNKGIEATKLVSIDVEVIGTINEFSLTSSHSSIKPNNSVDVSLLVNGKKGVINLSPTWNVTCNEETLPYEVVDESTIRITSSNVGRVKVNANSKNLSASIDVKYENIPVEQILKNSLPFVVLITLVALLIVYLVSKRKNPLDKLVRNLNSIKELINKDIEYIQNNIEDKNIKKRIKKLYKKCLSLSISSVALANYLSLEKSSDLINVLSSIKTLRNQLSIANKVGVKKLNTNQNLLVIKKILNTNVNPICLEIEEIANILRNFNTKVDSTFSINKRTKKINDFASKEKYDKFVNDAIRLADESSSDDE